MSFWTQTVSLPPYQREEIISKYGKSYMKGNIFYVYPTKYLKNPLKRLNGYKSPS